MRGYGFEDEESRARPPYGGYLTCGSVSDSEYRAGCRCQKWGDIRGW